jgi:hypothetical protein
VVKRGKSIVKWVVLLHFNPDLNRVTAVNLNVLKAEKRAMNLEKSARAQVIRFLSAKLTHFYI